jgi:adenosylmethionine-8-amino-7-oxononanoate aminotransferase
MGCAAALASLDVFDQERVLENLPPRIDALRCGLAAIGNPAVYEVRQCGLIAGIELRRGDRKRFPAAERIGERVCRAARAFGLLTRPIRDTIVLMPPLCSLPEEITQACEALGGAIAEVCGE